MTAAYLAAVTAPDQQVNPLFRHLGIAVERLDKELCVLRCRSRPHLMQGAGVLAGGILATLADEAMAHVVLAALGPEQRTATVELSMRYLRPVQAEEDLQALGRILKLGRSIVAAEAEVRDARDRLLGKAAASFIVLG